MDEVALILLEGYLLGAIISGLVHGLAGTSMVCRGHEAQRIMVGWLCCTILWPTTVVWFVSKMVRGTHGAQRPPPGGA